MPADRKYKIEVMSYNSNYNIVSNCNAITFYNNGTVDCKISTIPLPAGQSLSIEGNNDEIDTTTYLLDFGTSLTGNVFVIRKVNNQPLI
jgi:hypothetical protein